MKQMIPRLLLCAIVLLLCAAPASATASNESVAMPTYIIGDPQELEKFMDTVMKSQLSEQNIAGAVVVVVQDDQVLLAKGYGYADVEQQIPVDAEQTMFRACSVTKLFTWTAVMQLVEQGKLDLQADVNTYLTSFQVPDTYPQPITMLDLMSHTAGFGEIEISSRLGRTPLEELTSLEEFMQEYMPVRVYPPGQVPAYSNYGTSLAGYIVEQVSGEPYEQYVETHILQPLGMAHSTMHQPLPRELVSDMAQSYLYNGTYQPLPLDRLLFTPAGALIASGADMGKFMLAHLNDGEYDGARILQPETARLMHTQSYTFDPKLPGSAHGFEEQIINGWRLIGHSGDHAGFHTSLRLIPEEKVGIYVAFNSANVGDARETLLQMFMDHYFPAPQSESNLASSEDANLTEDIPLDGYTGFYINSRTRSYQDPKRIWALSSMQWIRPGPNNTLQRTYLLGLSVEGTLVPVQPMVFRDADTGALAIFKADEQGRVRYMRDSGSVATAIIRIKQPWYGGQIFHFGLLVFSLLTFLLTVIAAVVGFFISLRKRAAGRHSPWQARLARGAALALCLAFFILLAICIQTQDDMSLPIIPIMAWLIAILSAGVTFMAIAAWWKGWWGLAGRLHYTVIALVALAFTWFESYWCFLIF